jgi:fatty-acyl-CoA synthase
MVLGPREKRNVFFCGLPLFHANGQLVTGLVPWLRGDQVVLATPQGYRGNGVIQQFWKIVEHYGVNFFSGVPTVYAALLEQPVEKADISSLEYALCGAAPMPPELFRKFENKTGLRILEGYGLTEGACVSTINPPGGERRIGSVGVRLPYQPMRVALFHDDGRYKRVAATNEIGSILIQGPNVFDGYLNIEHEKSIWIVIDGQRWLNTGDLGRQDADGYIWLTGRTKELIIRSGHNIDPLSIEEPLLRHPDVQMVAAVGRPDPHVGEVPVAYVQLRAGAATSEEALLNHARTTIGERAAWPKAIRLIDQMPQTAVGKLDKFALRRREIQLTVLQALRDSGLHDSEIEVTQDQQVGLRVCVTTDSQQSRLKAEEVLGPFPFACSVFLAKPNLGRRMA